MDQRHAALLRYYSLVGLHERLREDAALHPDTIDQRYGAWAQLLVLFRIVYDGAQLGQQRLPPRRGVLFDPTRFPFLEGHTTAAETHNDGRVEVPLVPDGTVYRALESLRVLDGERISYRALDVEQIGSVYETMIGFHLHQTAGRSLAIKAQKQRSAPTAVDLEALLAEPPANRRKQIQDRADRKLTDRTARAVREAETVEDLHAALTPVADTNATPDLVPAGAMVLQPGEERRRSGSHYTPRELTEPIVRTTLEPILARLQADHGGPPRPGQILDLKILDPAMGSGAFLVEACRQLGDALVQAWHTHGETPDIPAGEDEVTFARRLVAQRCLYGVDRNPMAVDLAKVSLWLATLAKDHPLTFLAHALRHGDSLVGLTQKQIEALHWHPDKPRFQEGFEAMRVRERTAEIARLRQLIRDADQDIPDRELRDLWDQAQTELDQVRLLGDLPLAAYFQGTKPREREQLRNQLADTVVNGSHDQHRDRLQQWRSAARPLAPFHWHIEFPEVFDRPNPGFDAIIGNPPFAGKNTVAAGNTAGYPDWLKHQHTGSHGNSDLVAHFFRRAFSLLREGGAFGLIATNTIAQGDTRATGLRWICQNQGEIYQARTRLKWPGQAAVVVSVVHALKTGHDTQLPAVRRLDDEPVETITAFLFHRGGHDDPARLAANAGKSFIGSYVLGMGFTFDDTDTTGVATPLAEMQRLIEQNPRNQEVILPYIGGKELNDSPTHTHHRHVINFGERDEDECRQHWPELLSIVEEKVKPERMRKNRENYRRYWWQYGEKRVGLYAATAEMERVLITARISQYSAFALLAARTVCSENLVIIPMETYPPFSVLQCRPHEIWARFFGSSLGDGLLYTPSDCFETFPFPEGWETCSTLEGAGRAYYEFRASLMVESGEGLTKTYNRFHDPDEQDPRIDRLRELHAGLDRAVLDAYGWADIPTSCEFLLDYDTEEGESGSRRRKPWRYRWPDQTRDEVLARLLELNAERTGEEERSGLAAAKRKSPPGGRPAGVSETGALFQ